MKTPESVVDHLEVPEAQLLATLGCPVDRKPRGRLRRQIEKAVEGIRERVAYRSAFRHYAIEVEAGRVCVDGRITLRSVRLAQALRPCEGVYAYVVTLGREVDRFIEHWMEKRPDFGVVVDAVASVATDSMVARAEQEISEQLSPARALGLPFSPGYCDWPVDEQQKIFGLLPAGAAGVQLSRDAMMSPRKSISGVFGVGPVAAVTEAACPCCSCPRLDCTHRRRPYSGSKHEGNSSQRAVRPYRGRAAEFSVRTSLH